MFKKQFLTLFFGGAVAILGTIPALAQWKNLGPMAAEAPQGNQINFRSRTARVVIQVIAPDLIRVRMSAGKVQAPDYSWAVTKKDWPPVGVEFSGDKKTKVIKTSAVEARVRLSPFQISFYDPSGRLLSSDAREMA